MPTPTYDPITTVTATSVNNLLIMNNIPQTYTDLILVINGNTTTDDEIQLRYNSDNGSNYTLLFLYGSNSGTSSQEYANTTYAQLGGIYTTGTRTGSNTINIAQYRNTNVFKTGIGVANSGNYIQFRTNIWRSTSAITRIDAFSSSGSFTVGTTFSLYGILQA